MKINPDYFKQFRTQADKYMDDLYEEHLDGMCPGPSQHDRDRGYCQWCEEDRRKEQYEDTKGSK